MSAPPYMRIRQPMQKVTQFEAKLCTLDIMALMDEAAGLGAGLGGGGKGALLLFVAALFWKIKALE